jgi:hypothetical protein
MKSNTLSHLVLATALCTFPAVAADQAAADQVAAQAPAKETITLSIVACKGGGWGAANRVRAALTAQDGVKTVLVSGLRASVLMEEGKALDEAKIKAALRAKGMEFLTLTQTEMALPKASYVLQSQTATWAIKNDKARAALEKMDNVASAIVNGGVTILLVEDKPLDEKAITAALKEQKIIITETTKAEKLPF